MACLDCGCEVTGRNKRCPECKRLLKIARSDAWRAANPGASAKTRRDYYATHRGAEIAKMAEYRASNPELIKQIADKYRSIKAEELREKQRVRRLEKPDETKRLNAQRYQRHPEANKMGSFRRRSRGGNGRLSKGLSKRLYEQQKGLCACCGQSLGEKYHLDHIMPLALGGANEDANMQLLTARCNLQKNAKHPDDYMDEVKHRVTYIVVKT